MPALKTSLRIATVSLHGTIYDNYDWLKECLAKSGIDALLLTNVRSVKTSAETIYFGLSPVKDLFSGFFIISGGSLHQGQGVVVVIKQSGT